MDAIPLDADKKTLFNSVREYLESNDLSVKKTDDNRPWGGYFVIDDSSLTTFIEHFFPDFEQENTDKQNALSPKILMVGPDKRLSWQYHFRRSEYWTVAAGEVGVILSDNDEQKPVQKFEGGDVIAIDQGQRHRLVGLNKWGIVAEIWKHSDPSNPSNEDDIVRLEDDFGR